MTMDAQAQLALMAKAKLVFESGGKFLSFPALYPLAYSPKELDFAHALTDPEVGHALAEFSQAVNRPVAGPLYRGDGEPWLWEAYDRWLSDMTLAQDQMTAAEQAEYDRATALLTITDANGLTTDSPTLVAYKQRRDAWFSAVQSYKAAQLTSGASADPAVRDHWTSEEEPRLRALVAEAEAAWEHSGSKTTVEQAQALRARLDARRPSRAWSTWRGAFIPDIDLLTDTLTGSAVSYAPTAFAPSDVLAQDWPTFTLSSAEITALVGSAPAALRDLFAPGGGASSLTSLAFEFCSASLVRPWFRTDVFGAPFWRFGDAAVPLSDGADPPQGSWPAYVTGVVFARNIRVTTQAVPDQPQLLSKFSPATLRADLVRAPVAEIEAVEQPRAFLQQRSARQMAPAILAKASLARSLTADAATLQAQPAAMAETAPARPSAAMRLNALVYSAPTTNVFVAHKGVVWSTPLSLPPPDVSPPPAAMDKVSILAFICAPVPRTPAPDMTLLW
jgi:hypothetical protein